MPSITALLPMKANSERVPGKNFKMFAGKPLFRWILDTLLAVEAIDRVIINTDAGELLVQKGLPDSTRVRLHDRPAEICGDHVSMNLVLANDLSRSDADLFLMTHTTNPLISDTTIRAAIDRFLAALQADSADSLFSVNKYQTRFYQQDGTPINHDPNNLIRTQDLEPWFEENSCLYLFTRASFDRANARIGSRPILFETPRLESVDIDGPSDWALAELIATQMHGGELRT